MANEIKAAITPGIIEKPDQVLTLKFTAPKDATDVVIKVIEVDSWSVDGKAVAEPNAKDDLRAEIKGTLAGGKFTVSDSKTNLPPVNGKPPPAMNLKLDIDGKQIDVPFPNADGAKENGFFEVHFEITGTVKGQAGVKFASKSPVSFRTLPAGPEVVFISGNIDDFEEAYTKDYFPQATRFYKALKDNVIEDRKELIRIIGFLGTQKAERGNKPWGRVNIVAHGNDTMWAIRKSTANPKPLIFDSVATRRLVQDKDFDKPDPSDLTEQSQVVIRACEVGNDIVLLNEIKKLFGGKAKVFAPKFLLSYLEEDGVLKETLVAMITIFLPGHRNFPTAAEAKAAMIKRYRRAPEKNQPDLTNSPYRNFSDAQFAAAAAITNADSSAGDFREKTELTHFLRDPEDPDDVGINEKAISILDANGRIVRRMTNDELTKAMRNLFPLERTASIYDEHKWTWRAEQRQMINPDDPDEVKIFDLHGEGKTTMFDYFQVIRVDVNGKKVPITPDLNNPNHFGQSNL